MTEKVIRDPVHDVIAFRLGDFTDTLLFELIGCREVQRLRRIRQLGLAALVYPGADHCRYSHSLGVMQTARLMLDRLARDLTIDPLDRAAILAAALLHDLGHGPFSHLFEHVSGVRHEDLSRQIIGHPESRVHQCLTSFDKSLPTRVIDLIHPTRNRTWRHDILDSQLDADRFDYLLRDNLMTGSRYGHFDLRWLMQHLTIDPAADRLAVTHKGISAVEAYLQGRYHMYRNVYFHKAIRGAEGMVRLALQRARRLAVQERLTWPTAEAPVYKALLGMKLSVKEFCDLDDISVLHCFKVWAEGDDEILASLCWGLLFRELFKSIDVTCITDPEWLSVIRQTLADRIDAISGESAYELFYDQPADTPYDAPGGEAAQILIRSPDGTLTDFASLSPMSCVLAEQLTFKRIHFAQHYRQTVADVLAKY